MRETVFSMFRMDPCEERRRDPKFYYETLPEIQLRDSFF